MKRIYTLILLVYTSFTLNAQIQENDSSALFLDSLYMNLPELMITGERPIVRAEQGKLVYDLPRVVSGLPVNNALEAIAELPGIVKMGEALTLAGSSINIVIDGKVNTLSAEQLTELLKSIPVSNIEKAEVMYAAPARYQVRGPMVNLILKKKSEERKLTGELYSAWNQQHYARFTERASLLYSSPKFSADLLYSFSQGKRRSGMDKEALHNVNGTIHPMELTDRSRYKGDSHNIRLGMDYTLAPNSALSFVYTAQLSDYKHINHTWGTQNSETRKNGDSQLHNIKADYQSAFGLSAGAEFTFYESPDKQYINSSMNDEEINIRYDEQQRINKWRFYATQEHGLSNGWGLNYGVNYTTAVDNSYQNYFDMETNQYVPDNSMSARRDEYIANGFVGFNKSFGQKLSMNASLAAELYHSDVWNEWMFYPTLNATWLPSPGNIFQFALSSNKGYPEYWNVNSSITYLGTYTEIQGNPELKPASYYNASLSYIFKSKYILTAFLNYADDYFVQTLYQAPDRLVEIYKSLNFDYQQQFGIQMVIPFKVKNWLNSRVTATGYHKKEKDSDFWDIPFNRSHTSFMLSMNNTITLSAKPNLLLNISGYYQNGSIQGIYDLSHSGSLDASLRWMSDNQRFTLTLKGNDLLNTSQVDPKIKFKGQDVSNKFLRTNRGVELSFSYKLKNYKEKKREDVDTSRFK